MGGKNGWRKALSVILSVVLVCTMTIVQSKETQAASGTPFAAHGRLSVSGTKLVDASGQAYQLRGVSTFNLAWYPQYYTKAAFQSLRDDWGANAVRIVMYPHEYNGYCTVSASQQASYRASLLQCIKDAYDLGMYAILDWHVLNERDPNVYKTQALAFFKEMSASTAAYGNVLYEICNEPNGPAWSSIKSYAIDVIDTIRANDPNGIVIVGTPTWSQDVDTAAADPISRTNIMYTLHFYANTHRDWYRQKAQTAINAGLPLFVTEFGICDASGNGGLDKNEGNTWINFLDQNQISYCMWQLSNKNESASLISPSCNKTSGWTYDDLSESGKWYYNILTQRRETIEDTYTGFKQEADGTWYYYENGTYATGWRFVDSTWYYFNAYGAMQIGWLYENGKWYYLNGSGAMQTGWLYENEKWYYLNESGSMVTGWGYIGNTWYYFTENGAMQTGWLYENEKWYYLNGSGSMVTGWGYIGNTWYYFTESGVMQTGWLYENGKWYYLSDSGSMLTGWHELSGKQWYFDSNGVWQDMSITPD